MYENFINNIFQSSLIGSIMILLIIGLRKSIFKKYTKTFSYYLWITAILKMIILFRFSIFISNKIYNNFVKVPNIENSNLAISYNNYRNNIYLYKIIFYIWLIGLIIFFVYHVCSYLNFAKKVRFLAYDIDNNNINKLYSKILYELNIKKEIPLNYCRGIGSPLGIGIFKPIILLPEHTTYKIEEVELILKHELIHFKRYDLYYKILMMIVMSLHWFNPLVYIMWRQMNDDCELSCDEVLLKNSSMQLRKLYAMIFIKSLKSNKSNSSKVQIITGFNNNKAILKRRIEHIVNLNFRKKGLILGSLFLAISLISFLDIKTFGEINKIDIKPTINSTKINTKKLDDVKNIDNTEILNDEDTTLSKPRVVYKGPIKDAPKEFTQIQAIQEQIKENPDKYIVLQSK